MFTNTAIDTFQTSKKMVVDTFVKNEKLNKTLHGFVDAQTEYTKKACETAVETGKNVYSVMSDPSFYSDFLKESKDHVQSLFNTQKKGK